jgi:tetratricopeptide (TPR) repeat protein
LQKAATDLQAHGDTASARQLLEFVYNRQLNSDPFSATTFLGLAEIRLAQGDTKTAVALLRRMTLITGEPFESLSDAAELLSRTGHAAEAIEFLADRVRSSPWDYSAKAELGRLQAGSPMSRAVAEAADAPYEVRANAARAIGESKATAITTSSAELNLLSSAAPIPTASAEKPYFYRARVEAAAQSSDLAAKIRMLQGAASILPNADETKLQLFGAAYRAKRYQTAVAALHPLLAHGGIMVPEEPQAGGGSDQGSEQLYANRYYADQFVSGAVRLARHGNQPAPMDSARRAVIARNLADCYAKLNIPRDAEFYYRIALQIQPSDTEAKTQIRLLQAQLERQRANRQRKPVITANLEQDHVVRPRLAPQGGAQ